MERGGKTGEHKIGPGILSGTITFYGRSGDADTYIVLKSLENEELE